MLSLPEEQVMHRCVYHLLPFGAAWHPLLRPSFPAGQSLTTGHCLTFALPLLVSLNLYLPQERNSYESSPRINDFLPCLLESSLLRSPHDLPSSPTHPSCEGRERSFSTGLYSLRLCVPLLRSFFPSFTVLFSLFRVFGKKRREKSCKDNACWSPSLSYSFALWVNNNKILPFFTSTWLCVVWHEAHVWQRSCFYPYNTMRRKEGGD